MDEHVSLLRGLEHPHDCDEEGHPVQLGVEKKEVQRVRSQVRDI